MSVRGSKLTVELYLEGLDDDRRRRLRELSLESFESQDYREGTRAFLARRTGELLVLDVSDPRALRRVGGYFALGVPKGVVYSAGQVHFFDRNDLLTIDFTPANPQ